MNVPDTLESLTQVSETLADGLDQRSRTVEWRLVKEGRRTEGQRLMACTGMEGDGDVHNTAELLHSVDCRVKSEPGG